MAFCIYSVQSFLAATIREPHYRFAKLFTLGAFPDMYTNYPGMGPGTECTGLYILVAKVVVLFVFNVSFNKVRSGLWL